MERFTRGQVVLVRFPFSDLSASKLRPALVLATAEYGDLLLCQITSKNYNDRRAVQIQTGDFESGSLPLTSYARPSRLFSADESLVARSLGSLKPSAHQAVIDAITGLLKSP
jgi:mRNA interferase MazF